MDSLVPNLGQQESNLQPSNLLQFSGGTSSQAGSYGNSFGDLIEMDTIDIETNQFAQAVDEILGNFPIFEDSTVTSESPNAADESLEFSDDNDPLIGNVSSLLAEVVWDTALSTVQEELETFTEDLAENIFDSTIANLGEQMGVLTPPEEPAAPDSSDSLNEMALELGIFRVREQLENFANDEEFLDKMEQAFDDDFSSKEASNLIQDLASGEAIPEIEIVPASELNNANGAFGEGTIYLSEEFLSENVTNLEAVEDVLLEEIGHYIDEELGSDDSEGDEGDIFAQLVQDDETIADGELDDLQDEDDSADVGLDDEEITVELATPEYPGYPFIYEEGENVTYDSNVETWQQQMKDVWGYNLAVDGLYGPESEGVTIDFQEDQGLAVDGIVGPNTWEASFAVDDEPRTPYEIESGDTLSEIAEEELGDSSLWREIEKEDGTTFTEEQAITLQPGDVVYLPTDDEPDVVSIAIEEWEFFDRGELKEDEEGGWQRVAEYWDSVEEYYHDLTGKDTDVPWSAAFTSWVMKEAGAGDEFNYSASHSNYITDAIENKKENDTDAAFIGHRLSEYSPQPGDLVGRARQSGVGYDTPPTYQSHADIVVETRPGEIDVIGGNVSDSVTLKTLPVDSEGRLINTDSRSDNDWFVVIENQLSAIA
ncbi:DUF2272 domain-containing protein [Capilliphycus salinus ALCB114379]|uniref:DUF2272 domain-containing protein n=1 Tax=Capilliphycus salinus TaxID=2768948 RepID=UPI0039A6314A